MWLWRYEQNYSGIVSFDLDTSNLPKMLFCKHGLFANKCQRALWFGFVCFPHVSTPVSRGQAARLREPRHPVVVSVLSRDIWQQGDEKLRTITSQWNKEKFETFFNKAWQQCGIFPSIVGVPQEFWGRAHTCPQTPKAQGFMTIYHLRSFVCISRMRVTLSGSLDLAITRLTAMLNR